MRSGGRRDDQATSEATCKCSAERSAFGHRKEPPARGRSSSASRRSSPAAFTFSYPLAAGGNTRFISLRRCLSPLRRSIFGERSREATKQL
uniref:Uncharacterized protein n=1 Tax=Arundo donax TaxID=35708 RepID=A0A0A8XMT1_ARUDO